MPKSLDDTIKQVTASLTERGLCAWGGCAARFEGHQLPPRWAALAIGTSPLSQHSTRQAVLCPKHAAELDGLLKGIGGPLGDLLAIKD